MEVIDHEPRAWFLLRDGDALLLEVRCSHSAADFSILVELNATERAGYTARGHAYLVELAEAIQFSAPGVAGSRSPYTGRDLTPSLGPQADAAVKSWLKRPALRAQPGLRQ